MSSELMSSEELSRMQADAEAYLLPDTCNILSQSRVSDGQGGFTVSWGTAYASVRCRVDANPGGNEIPVAESLQEYGPYLLSVPHDTDLSPEDRIEHGGHTYSITSVKEDNSWAMLINAAMEKVDA